MPPVKPPTDDQLLELGAKVHEAERQRTPSTAERVYQGFIKPAVLPTGLSYAGGVVGGAAGGVLGNPALGFAAGSSLGSGLGEAANQALGITDPSLSDIGTAMAVPAALYGLGQLGHSLFRMGPKHGAQAINAIASDEAMIRLGKYGDPAVLKTQARQFFKMASDVGGKIPVTKTMGMIDDWIPRLQQGSEATIKMNAPVINRLNSLKKLIQTKTISPTDLQAELHNLDVMIDGIRKQGGAGKGAYQAVRSALADELDEAANAAAHAFHSGKPVPFGGAGAAALVQGRDAWKRGTLLSDMADRVTHAVKVLRGQEGFTQFNAAEVIRWLDKDKWAKQVFTPIEHAEIKQIFAMLNKIPALQPQASLNVGSKRVMTMAMSGAGAAASAHQLGMSAIPTIAAGAAGVAVPPLAETAHNIAIAMQMQTGRALLRQLLTETKGAITPQALSILGAYTTAVTQQPDTEMTQ